MRPRISSLVADSLPRPKVSPHAIDRASQRLLPIWKNRRRGQQGLNDWLAESAYDAYRRMDLWWTSRHPGGDRINVQLDGIRYVFTVDPARPVLVTVLNEGKGMDPGGLEKVEAPRNREDYERSVRYFRGQYENQLRIKRLLHDRYTQARASIDALEAQLAEAKALLREAPVPSQVLKAASDWTARRTALLGEEGK